MRYGVAWVAAALMFTSSVVWAKETSNLYGYLSKQSQPIRLYVEDIQQKESALQVDSAAFKTDLEKTLQERKSIRFAVVKTSEEADLILRVAIHDYYWTDDDPIEPLTSLPMMAYDAVTKEKYARLRAKFVVLDAKRDRVIWSELVKSTVSDAHMSEQEGSVRAHQELIQHFIRFAFSKPKKNL